jgi:hypothetical protein
LLFNVVTLVSWLSQRFCILNLVGSDRDFVNLFFSYNFSWISSYNFLFANIKLQLFPSHFCSYGIIMFSFNLLEIGLRTFFLALFFFLYGYLNLMSIVSEFVIELGLIEDYFIDFLNFFLSFALQYWVFNTPDRLRSGSFYLSFVVIFLSVFFYCCCIFYSYYLNYQLN